MTERDDNGQFTSAAEPLTGQLGVEADQGFKPMPTPLKETPEESSSLEAEALNLALSREAREEAAPLDEELKYLTPTGETVDQNETVPLDRAAKDLSAYHEAKAAQAIQTASSDLAAQVDALRAEALKANPQLAEHYGIDAEETLAKAEATEKATVEPTAQAEESYAPTDGLDPVLEKQIREHPQVRQMLESELTQSYQVREQYSQALNQASAFARASFLETVPELAGLPEAQIEAGLHVLQQTNPQRFAVAMNTLQRVAQIQGAQQQMQQQHAAVAHAQWQSFTKDADARLAKESGKSAAELSAIGPRVIEHLEALGISRDVLAKEWNSNPLLRSAEGQKVLMRLDELEMKNKELSKAAKAVPPNLPPVSRPGTRSSSPRSDDAASSIRALERQLDSASGNKALQVAAKLQAAKRAASNR